MSPPAHPVLTIGHSTHPLATFVELLRMNAVTALADVRSAPHSRFNPHFNRENLEKALVAHGIRYVFLGRELGGRSDDPSCYRNGRVHYALLAQTESFRAGIERVIRGAGEHRVALMCAEKEPLDCHRTLLVAPALTKARILIEHILADGRVESHEAAMDRLLGLLGLLSKDLFRSKGQLIEEALIRQADRVAYVDDEVASTEPRGPR